MEGKRDLAVSDDAAAFLERGLGEEDLLADHGVVLVVGVVCVAELAIGAKLKLQKLVAELALVTDVVADVELAHLLRRRDGRHRCTRIELVFEAAIEGLGRDERGRERMG